ncbi:hypothetical protein ACFPOG_04535, partial [Paenibacillus aestuarii]
MGNLGSCARCASMLYYFSGHDELKFQKKIFKKSLHLVGLLWYIVIPVAEKQTGMKKENCSLKTEQRVRSKSSNRL